LPQREDWKWLLLAGVLLLAQTLLALHEAEHLGHLEEDACSICVLGAPLGAAIPGSASFLVPARSDNPWPIAGVCQPTLRPTFCPHCARAPPASGIA